VDQEARGRLIPCRFDEVLREPHRCGMASRIDLDDISPPE
jgi:hypothetical protein